MTYHQPSESTPRLKDLLDDLQQEGEERAGTIGIRSRGSKASPASRKTGTPVDVIGRSEGLCQFDLDELVSHANDEIPDFG